MAPPEVRAICTEVPAAPPEVRAIRTEVPGAPPEVRAIRPAGRGARTEVGVMHAAGGGTHAAVRMRRTASGGTHTSVRVMHTAGGGAHTSVRVRHTAGGGARTSGKPGEGVAGLAGFNPGLTPYAASSTSRTVRLLPRADKAFSILGSLEGWRGSRSRRTSFSSQPSRTASSDLLIPVSRRAR